jgi:hypothetical protein
MLTVELPANVIAVFIVLFHPVISAVVCDFKYFFSPILSLQLSRTHVMFGKTINVIKNPSPYSACWRKSIFTANGSQAFTLCDTSQYFMSYLRGIG